MKIMAVVPMRGGSKSIPYKNIADLNGKPLCYYTINELLKVEQIDKVVVSTENEKIKGVVNQLFNGKVFILDRPAELASDTATSEVVLSHVIEKIGQDYDYTLFAQCTSPLTEATDFINLIDSCKDLDSAGFYTECYDYFYSIANDVELMVKPRQPRQLKTPRKKEAGNAWMFNNEGFLKHRTRLFGKIGMCKIDFIKNLEIDEPEDLEMFKGIMMTRGKI